MRKLAIARKPAVRLAAVRFDVHAEGIVYGKPPTHRVESSMTTDLPADNLGEGLADAIQRAWKEGFDPTEKRFSVVVTFR